MKWISSKWTFDFHVKFDQKCIHCILSVSEPEAESSLVRSSIEGSIKVVREACCDCVNAIKDKKKPVDQFISTGMDHSQCMFRWILASFPEEKKLKININICSYIRLPK